MSAEKKKKKQKNKKKGGFAITLGLLLIAAALCLTAYNVWVDRSAGEQSAEALSVLLPELPAPEDVIPPEGRPTNGDPAAIEYPDYVIDPTRDLPVRLYDDERYVGVLSLPSIGIELPVFDEWSYPRLRVAPCRYVGTPYAKDMVVCGHNYDRHFGRLKTMRMGDRVTFTDMAGNVFSYEVAEVEILRPTAVEEMTGSEYPLSLFTCTIGGRTRVTVRCREVSVASPAQ